MRVRVKLLAVLRRYMPADCQGSSCELDVPAGTCARDLLLQLGVPLDDLDAVAILVNGRAVPADHVLQEDDALAAFPAMAGG